jgi:hypothetical protein
LNNRNTTANLFQYTDWYFIYQNKITIMEKKLSIAFAVITICILLISCTKTGPGEGGNAPVNIIPWDQADGGCELGYSSGRHYYADPLYNKPFQLIRQYDLLGRRELLVDFYDTVADQPITLYHFTVLQSGSDIFLIDVQNSTSQYPDTAMRIKLDNNGRAQSYQSHLRFSPVNGYKPESEIFAYKNNRLYTRNITRYEPEYGVTYNFIDTFRYDAQGNVISHLANSYKYDYSRKAKQQYYDDYIDNSLGFPILQYLTLFPELTSPANVRTHVTSGYYDENTHVINTVFDIPLLNHQFDSNGFLISYDAGTAGNTAKIVWSCAQLSNN